MVCVAYSAYACKNPIQDKGSENTNNIIKEENIENPNCNVEFSSEEESPIGNQISEEEPINKKIIPIKEPNNEPINKNEIICKGKDSLPEKMRLPNKENPGFDMYPPMGNQISEEEPINKKRNGAL